MNAALEFLQKFGPGRIAAMGAVTLAMIGFFAFVILRVSQPSMGVLYSDLSMQDATTIIRDLESKGIKYEARNDGQTILAPRSDIGKIRMELAGKGLPTGGGVGYEIFDKGDAFSSTSFVQGINHLRALEGELSRTIRTIGRIRTARVHLAIPEKRLFERDREPPRASIVLALNGELDLGQIRAIRHLAASAVEGLKPENISIVDERGRLLADGAQGEAALAGLALQEKQTSIEQRLRNQVTDIVAGIVGDGHAKVQVAAELDVNRVESRAESYDPESRVVRSSQTRTDNQVTSGQEGAVSVGNELPGTTQGAANNASKDTSNKNEEVVNYEISRTTRTEVIESGRIKRLSVAVLVDGVYTKAASGEVTYQPRPPEELSRIAALVRMAIGFDSNRGDQVEVANLRFASPPPMIEGVKSETSFSALLSPTKEDILRGIELLVISFLTLLVLMVVVRPLVKKILSPVVVPKKGGSDGGDSEIALAMRNNPTVKMIEMAKISGQVQAESIEKVGELVGANPTETVSVLRQWIQERG